MEPCVPAVDDAPPLPLDAPAVLPPVVLAPPIEFAPPVELDVLLGEPPLDDEVESSLPLQPNNKDARATGTTVARRDRDIGTSRSSTGSVRVECALDLLAFAP
jgi:hypothetical protein